MPGRIGLLAIHAHAYGRPVVTCDDMNFHSPEIEIVQAGKTGALFRRGDAGALGSLLRGMLSDPENLQLLGKQAYLRAHTEFGIKGMLNGFLRAISYVTQRPVSLLN